MHRLQCLLSRTRILQRQHGPSRRSSFRCVRWRACEGGPRLTQFDPLQLYMNRDRKKVEQALINARELGYKAILLTVDTPIPGNRELDLRTSIDPESSEVIDEAGPASAAAPPPGAHQLAIAAAAQFIDASLNWQDIAWVKKVSGLPVVVKGVQTVEDALLCVEYGAEGMMLSNHGALVKTSRSSSAFADSTTLCSSNYHGQPTLHSCFPLSVSSGGRQVDT